MIELTFLKELMLLRQVHQKTIIGCFWYFSDKWFKFQLAVCNECHDALTLTILLF